MMDMYERAGVNVGVANAIVESIKSDVRSTYTADVLSDVGSFAGALCVNDIPDAPVLVASTDGVGTKTMLAATHQHWKGIGHDVVNHCVNDVLTMGARPLLFLNHIAAHKLVPENIYSVVSGMSEACRLNGCALLGGETAEMPGIYTKGSCDVSGTVVGVASQLDLPWPTKMEPGDLIYGLPSNGPHTNGFSLIRRILDSHDPNFVLGDGFSVLEAVMRPHTSYLNPIARLKKAGVILKGTAHITGGGIEGNVPRVMPPGLRAHIDRNAWDKVTPLVFRQLIDWGQLDLDEAYRVFNMGIGMVLIVNAEQSSRVESVVQDAILIGILTATSKDPHVVWRG